MPFTYNPLCPTDLDKVRLLCTDTYSVNPLFEDGEINAFLGLMLNNVLRAASVALLTIAAQETLLMKRIKLLELTTDGPAEADALRALALIYQEKADLAEAATAGGSFDYAELATDDFTYWERLAKEALRSSP